MMDCFDLCFVRVDDFKHLSGTGNNSVQLPGDEEMVGSLLGITFLVVPNAERHMKCSFGLGKVSHSLDQRQCFFSNLLCLCMPAQISECSGNVRVRHANKRSCLWNLRELGLGTHAEGEGSIPVARRQLLLA